MFVYTYEGGLFINIVGLFMFASAAPAGDDHGHGGHNHGHGGHDHGHAKHNHSSSEHSHDHETSPNHNHKYSNQALKATPEHAVVSNGGSQNAKEV